MFRFKENKKNDFTLIIVEKDNFLTILKELSQILKNSENNGQSLFINQLVELLYNNEFSQFIKLINSVDMWGGAGAVWEVYIENKNEAYKFETEIIKLICLMEKTKIIVYGILQIKRFFEKNIKE
jgi:hypothetical protein